MNTATATPYFPEQGATLEEAREALFALDPDCDRADWVKIGMAAKAAGLDFDDFDRWSAGGRTYKPKDVQAVWKSFSPSGGVTERTLFKLARDAGWRPERSAPISPEEAARRQAQAERRRLEREASRQKEEAEAERRRQETATLAARLWDAATPVTPGDPHPYLERKGVLTDRLREIPAEEAARILGWRPEAGERGALAGRLLVIPLERDGAIATCELIDGDGRKTSLPGQGTKSGTFWPVCGLPDGNGDGATILVGEGAATALSAHAATGYPAIAVSGTANLRRAAEAMRTRYPAARVIVLADLDKESGTPCAAAIKAAQETGSMLAAPCFGEERPEGATDFNDMHQAQGLAAVRQAIEAATELEEPQAEPIDESTLDDDARHLLEALRAIKPSAMLGKHPAEHVIGLALRHVASGIEESIGRALAREWDRLTGGRSAAIFEAADPNYSATAPLTTASIFKLAKACGWSGEVPWSEPEPLIADVEALDYPLDALPHSIRAAVEEVQAYVQAPVSLVATSALASLSLAIQSGFDVRRADKLCGPCGLFLLTIAESGERKSTIDGFFMKAIREHEREEAAAAAPVMEQYMADMEAWEAKRQGIKTKITKYAGSKDTKELEESLRKLGRIKPEAPRVPRYIYTDTTPEALAFELGKRWPTGGVISSEAGIVFGGHAMGRDSVMRNLALLNQLWDGAGLRIDRRSSESFEVNGARLTVWLQIQEQTLREFFTKTGSLARGSGFLARFLVAWPESTQGTRFYQEPPSHWPALAAFNTRLKDLLAQPPAFDEKDVLKPVTLPLSPEAKQAWIAFHDAIESELATGGELQDVRDVASKIAENAARIAALLHVFEHGGGAISLESFERASRIAAWHLNESRRFFGELAQPQDISDAARLDAWILAYCQHQRSDKIGKRYLRQYGPVRDGERLDAALAFLEELGRIRQRKSGKQATIEVNPRLLGGAA
ncbi:DUF3987 domain-containing protein [Tepidiphilus sp. HLB4]